MTATLTSTDNKTTKVKRPKENRFYVFLFFFCPSFVLWWFFFFYAFVKLRKFFITKNLVFIFKLNIVENLYYIEKDFAIILVFLCSCHSLGEIANEEEKIYKYINVL
jgi:hypothetical protein